MDIERDRRALPRYLWEALLEHPYREFILARASSIAFENRGGSSYQESDVNQALAELESVRSSRKSLSGFCYAFGGAILSVGLGAWITGLYFMVPPFTTLQLLPFIILSIVGFLLIVEGMYEK